MDELCEVKSLLWQFWYERNDPKLYAAIWRIEKIVSHAFFARYDPLIAA